MKIRSWKTDDDFDPGFKKILVLGMIERVSFRTEAEEAIVIQARKNKLEARMGYVLFPPDLGNPFEDMSKVRNGLVDKGFDALLSVAIFGTSAKRYIPPEKVYVPIGYYNRFGSYYSNSYAVYRTPGYITTEDQYFIECNLYSTWGWKTHLVWKNFCIPSKLVKFTDCQIQSAAV